MPGPCRTPARGWPRLLGWLVIAALAGGGIGIAARGLDIRPVRVTSGSMSPTIKIGDWIVTRDVDASGRRAIDRDDIVMFRFPLGTTGRAIKRVIALEGDRVAISARTVTVNSRVIPVAGAPSANAARARVETVPRGHLFVLGDNHQGSIDSRSFGHLPETEIVARELLVIRKSGLMWAIPAIAVTVGVLLLVAWRRRRQAPR